MDEIANKIIAILRHASLAEEIVERSREQLRSVHWEKAAEKIVAVRRPITSICSPLIVAVGMTESFIMASSI